jgi:hypothetical protein
MTLKYSNVLLALVLVLVEYASEKIYVINLINRAAICKEPRLFARSREEGDVHRCA